MVFIARSASPPANPRINRPSEKQDMANKVEDISLSGIRNRSNVIRYRIARRQSFHNHELMRARMLRFRLADKSRLIGWQQSAGRAGELITHLGRSLALAGRSDDKQTSLRDSH